eukprot:TRINITY_DN24341_c0_g1_i1.p1 TRINITY_DN24341_c0_g1~~TRINITY_DN24341_c0_g1_i1.p1  ORF type:complete len:1544 (-),score=257.84 TRINITY_DN24341_c0_g1_i1:122-4753(-)
MLNPNDISGLPAIRERPGSRGQPASRPQSRNESSSRPDSRSAAVYTPSASEGRSRLQTVSTPKVVAGSGSPKQIDAGKDSGESEDRKKPPRMATRRVAAIGKTSMGGLWRKAASKALGHTEQQARDAFGRASESKKKIMNILGDYKKLIDVSNNGFLSDFLIRSLHHALDGNQARRIILAKPSPSEQNCQIMEEAMEVVRTERLLNQLRRIITDNYKAQGAPGWRITGKEFKERAAEIIKFKRMQLCLKADVDNWVLRLKLQRAEVGHSVEDQKGRGSRLKEFWTTYHTSYRFQDTPADLVNSEPLGVISMPAAGGQRGCAGSRHENLYSTSDTDAGTWGQERKPLKSSAELSSMPMASTVVSSSDIGTPLTLPKTPSASSTLLPKAPNKNARPSSSWYAHGTSRVSTAVAQVPEDGWKLRNSRSRAGVTRGSTRGGTSEQGGLFPSLAATTSKGLEPFQDWGFAKTQPTNSIINPERRLALKPKKMFSSTPSLPSMLSSLKAAPFERRLCQTPHQKGGGGPELRNASSATQRYVRACSNSCVLPNLIPFCTGHSNKLNAAGQGFCDTEFQALTSMILTLNDLQEVDLDENTLLTDQSLVPFLQQLAENRARRNLQKLSLKKSLQKASPSGVHEVILQVVNLVETSLPRLQHLDLSSVPMQTKSHLPLCKAVRDHPSIKSLGLADVRLGYNHPNINECLSFICQSPALEQLALGWNPFDKNCFVRLGECLRVNTSINKLSLANSSCQDSKACSSVEYFLELLAYGSGITQLDISLNRLTYQGALVLEASLEHNLRVKTLNISQNPLAVLGFRSVLRLLSRETSGLLFFECEGCCVVDTNDAESSTAQVFSETNPGGLFHLDLQRPYDRALLRMLYRTCDRFNLTPHDAFTKLSSNISYEHPVREAGGVRSIPTEGILEITFSVEVAMEKVMQGVPDADFTGVLRTHFQMTRVRPGKAKQAPLFAQWKQIQGQSLEQLTMLEALSKDFYFNYPQYAQICQNRAAVSAIAWRLLPCVEGGGPTRFLSLLHMPSIGEYMRLAIGATNLLMLNIENPTGHYKLNLSNCCDYAVAEQLMLLDRWEVQVAIRQNLENTSQTVLRANIRNARFQERNLHCAIMDFTLPESGSFEFDYTSTKKPPADARALDHSAFDSMLVSLQNAECSPWQRINAITPTSHYWYLTSLQMRGLMGIFKDSAVRAEIFVRLALRLIDVHNEKIFRARFEDAEEFGRLLNRLGHAAFFPFIQPEQTKFHFNYGIYDQRLAANMLVGLAREENIGNIVDFAYIRAGGIVDPLPMGIPRSWDSFDKMPTDGTFTCTYVCAPEDRKYAKRKALSKKYGYYTAPEQQSDVMWWSSIATCPEDVIEFVEFINSNFKNIWRPFRIIDGPDGNGEISFKEFQEGIKKLKCKKFAGPDEDERIRNVFRFLDPSGEGKVSKGEWSILQQLYEEIRLSIKEFVEFCARTFGGLDEAWEELDDDGSGEIDEEEWSQSLQRAGFFGLAGPIFSFLDKDDEGTVSLDEFELLEEFQDENFQHPGGFVIPDFEDLA